MKLLAVSLIPLLLVQVDSQQLENLVNTPLHKCIECLCHARTNCYSRITCASYSITFEYWRQAGSPTINVNDPESRASYNACMRNENCILNTIKLYTDGFGQPNCDCNDIYDCRDMLMLHLNGEKCTSTVNSTYRERYNRCAGRNDLAPIGSSERCVPQPN